MFSLVDAYRASGQTRPVFCREHGLSVSTLAYWVTRKNKADRPAGGFTELISSSPTGPLLELTYPNGVRLAVESADLGLVARLIGLADV